MAGAGVTANIFKMGGVSMGTHGHGSDSCTAENIVVLAFSMISRISQAFEPLDSSAQIPEPSPVKPLLIESENWTAGQASSLASPKVTA